MWLIYSDGFLAERCFTQAEIDDAVAYWGQHGEVEVREATDLIKLY